MKRSIINEIGRSINEISGMEITVVDKYFNCMHISKRRGADFCNVIHACPGGLDYCRASDKVNLARAAEEKHTCRFVCPFGIDELIIPILQDDSIEGYLISSMGINSDGPSDEELARAAAEKLSGVSYEDLLHELSLVPHFSNLKLESYVRILEMFANKIETDVLIDNDDNSLGAMIKLYVRDNIEKRITLADISYYLHRSTVSITQHFKAEYGITVMQYVTKKRLDKAERLLRTGDDAIKNVALSSGFEEVEYFSRCFKKHYGKTPSEYRAAYRKSN